MSFFDLISELRTKDANPEKAAKAMKVLAVVCLVVGIWNYAVIVIAPFDRMPFNIDPAFPNIALISGIFLGGLFFLASRGISDKAAWGKRLGQLAVVLLVASIIAAFFILFSGIRTDVPMPPAPFLIIFSIIFVAQFLVPAYFGIQYLGRLPIDENSYVRPAMRPDTMMRAPAPNSERRQPMAVHGYKESPVPFGVVGTFAILLGVPMIGIMFAQKYANPAAFGFLFAAMFLIIFLGPALYNRMPSSFEQTRTVAASYTGGGSLLMFNGSWPFFRLLVYDDGVEVRVMFHRFFIPYDKMEDLPEKIKFFSSGILFKSDLPGVPSRIRFYGFSSKKILEVVKERRSRFLP
jgi:uncharacterized membrane protein (UPF0136 family)